MGLELMIGLPLSVAAMPDVKRGRDVNVSFRYISAVKVPGYFAMKFGDAQELWNY